MSATLQPERMWFLSFQIIVIIAVSLLANAQQALPADQQLASANVAIIGEDSSTLRVQSRQGKY